MISGGWLYHLRAAKNSRLLWQTTRLQLFEILTPILQHHSDLILFGPSAGYLLPSLRNHQGVRIDWDGLSHLLFQKKHGTGFENWREDLFPNGQINGPLIQKALDRNARALLFFTNILGQIPLQYGWRSEHRNWEELHKLVGGRSCLSVHDRLSTSKGRIQKSDVILSPRKLEDLELLESFEAEGAWTEHGTRGLFQEADSFWYLPWRLTSKKILLLEVTVQGQGSRGIRSP